MDSFFAAQERAHFFSGTVLVAQGERILLSKGYGMADDARQIHNSSDTQFAAPLDANMEFAMAALLQFEQAGKLRAGDRICAFIPHCPATWAPITVRQLLNFTSGMSDYLNESQNSVLPGQSLTHAELVCRIGLIPMDFQPGTSCCSWTSSPMVADAWSSRSVGNPSAPTCSSTSSARSASRIQAFTRTARPTCRDWPSGTRTGASRLLRLTNPGSAASSTRR